jgi:hypothetical protein
VNKFVVLFSFVGCSILMRHYGSHPCSHMLSTLIALANDVKKVHFMFGGEDFRGGGMRLAEGCMT